MNYIKWFKNAEVKAKCKECFNAAGSQITVNTEIMLGIVMD